MLMIMFQTVNHLSIKQKIVRKTEERPDRPAQPGPDDNGNP